MLKHEQERLEKLRNDANKGIDRAKERLTFADLIMLLREERSLRTLIRDIVAQPDSDTASQANSSSAVAINRDAAVRGEPPHAPPVLDPLRQELASALALLKAVHNDAELAECWLGEQVEPEGHQLLRLVACSAQWDLLSDLWEKLANRCKHGQRPANSGELHILHAALSLHNLRWQGRQAQSFDVTIGTAYDYERHQRGTPTGDCVRALWLPGLVNAGGQLHKKPLVQT